VVHGPGVWTLDTAQAFAADGVLALQIHGIAAGPCNPCVPTLVFKQGVSFDGTLRVTMNDHSFMYASLTYWLFHYGGGLPSGRFSRIELPRLDPSLGWNTDSLYVSGHIIVQSPHAVPEPSTGALWLAGLALAGGVARRRHRA
jgi:PEP-CTERM motif